MSDNSSNSTRSILIGVIIGVLIVANILVAAYLFFGKNDKSGSSSADNVAAVTSQPATQQATTPAQAQQATARPATTARPHPNRFLRGHIDPPNPTRVVVNCHHWMNLRSGPGKNYPKAGYLIAGRAYKFVCDAGDFYGIEYQGGTYYCSKEYTYATDDNGTVWTGWE